jgi:hypothetical protein
MQFSRGGVVHHGERIMHGIDCGSRLIGVIICGDSGTHKMTVAYVVATLFCTSALNVFSSSVFKGW